MEGTRRKIIVTLILGMSALGTRGAPAGESQSLPWNEAAQSTVLNRSELGKVGAALPPWKIKQMVWPPSEELRSAAVMVDEKLEKDCVDWLTKFIDAKQLPEDVRTHLVAMKAWGLVRSENEQKRLCDVFIARFRKSSYSVHIQESPGNVLITIGCESLPPDANPDPQALVFQLARVFLKEELRPNPQSKHLYVSRNGPDGVATTRITWQIDSVLREDEKGNTYRNGGKAAELGTWHVVAETNGRYVRFDIQKFVNAPMRLDPCAERF